MELKILRWFCCMKRKLIFEVEAALYASVEVRPILSQFELQRLISVNPSHVKRTSLINIQYPQSSGLKIQFVIIFLRITYVRSKP